MTSSPRDPWLVRQAADSRPSFRLVCFPFAGGGSAAFRGWESSLPSGVEVVSVQPPGRELRLLEPAFRRMGALLEALAPRLLPLLEGPFSFFGHSMGALIAFELAHELRRRGRTGPRHLFVSASRAPHVPESEPPIFSLSDPEFIDRLRERYDGIPDEVLESEELMELLLPNLKADLELVETYEPPAEMLSCPISCFGGSSDRRVREEHLRSWAELTTGAFRLRVFEGDHFYLTSQRSELLQELTRSIGSAS